MDPADTPRPLWDYAVELYGCEGVAGACLELQDRLGLDVNLLLFCIWSAVDGPGRLPRGSVADCIALAGPWRRQVVEPLRAVRREALGKATAPAGVRAAFRDRLLELELEAERIELGLLEEWSAGRPREVAADPAATAAGNLAVYLAEAGVAMGDAAPAIRQILAAAFPPATPA